MLLVVGLGNPGERYLRTRHNLGFMAIDAVAKKIQGSKLKIRVDERFDAEILNAKTEGISIILAKPQTFMNASGIAVRKIADYYKVEPENIWVIHDDVDLPLGKVKIRLGGASAGHRGVQSIIEELGTDAFIRIRLGINHPRHQAPIGTGAGNIPVEAYVLKNFDVNEKTELKRLLKKTVDIFRVGAKEGIDRAMNEFNQ